MNTKKKRKKSIFHTEGFKSAVLLAPYGLVFSMFILIPVAIAIGLSFTYFDVINKPSFTGLLNYITLFTQDETFLKFVLPNTFLYALVVGPGGYALSFLLASMLTQIQALPRTILTLAIYTPSMASQVFIGVVWRTLFSGDQNGYVNYILMELDIIDQPIQFLLTKDWFMEIMIFVSLWSAMGVGFLAMISGILNINDELYEAAYVDGMKNRFQEIFYITIPSMKPQMLFAAVMQIVGAFQNGSVSTMLAGNPTPGYAAQLIVNHIEDYGFIRYEMGYAAAVSVVLLLIVQIFSKLSTKLFGEND